jgi:hypothetical protein
MEGYMKMKQNDTAGRADISGRAGRVRLGLGGRLAPLAIVALGSLALCGTAVAAGVPAVATGAAKSVGYASATLTGTVNPHGSDTSYYFQYGPTKAYGGQTTIASAGAGTTTLNVSLPVSGLQPLSVYHYRLVAVNAAGPSIDSDHAFMTTAIPLSLAILASPNPIPYGGTIVVQGTLSGTGNAGRQVILQANPFPFTAGFQNVGNVELTTAGGGFSFPVLGLTLVTQYRVSTTTNAPVVSPATVENVAVNVTSHVARTHRPHFARIYGTVSPAQDGMQIGFLRIVHGRGVLVGGTTLHHLSATSSSYSRVVPVRPGIYRVLARVTTGAQVSAYGQPLAIH